MHSSPRFRPIQTAERFSFSGHESFPLRYAWLTKAVEGVTTTPNLFTLEEAPLRLGVGKNMAASIRHWALTVGVIEPLPEGPPGHLRPTEFGQRLFGADGWDRALEDPATIWVLHWLLVRNAVRASTWHLAFTLFPDPSFTREHLADWLLRIASQAPQTRVTSASMRRDVDVFVRSYVSARPTKREWPEDTFDSPLTELGLIQEVDGRSYRFVRNQRQSLPDAVFVFALLDFWDRTQREQRTMSFETLAYAPGCPGAAFKLTENALAERLERLPAWSGLSYDETAGTRVVFRDDSRRSDYADPLWQWCLERHYVSHAAGVA